MDRPSESVRAGPVTRDRPYALALLLEDRPEDINGVMAYRANHTSLQTVQCFERNLRLFVHQLVKRPQAPLMNLVYEEPLAGHIQPLTLFAKDEVTPCKL